jgi:phosphoribosylaminoimidazolecarboxamide formyltransferase/IMP cyclohydrolase
LAAFGGVVAFSTEVDTATATEMVKGERFLEVVVAPSFAPLALTMLQSRWKNARILAVGHSSTHGTIAALALRSIPGGILAQQQDLHPIRAETFVHAAGPEPTPAMRRDAGAMFVVAKHLKSNAVCIGCNLALLGAGAGQMDRVASCRGAIVKARAHLDALSASDAPVAASDAFFPFADGPTLLVDAGIKCIVHPGGSKRDQDTIDLCQQRGITCLVAGSRHFRH